MLCPIPPLFHTRARARSFAAEEAIGYIRLCRPGSVIGPQQLYLKEIEPLMRREGAAWRARAGDAAAAPPLAWGPAAPGRAAAMLPVRLGASVVAAAAASAAPAAAAAKAGITGRLSLVVDATGDSAASTPKAADGSAASSVGSGLSALSLGSEAPTPAAGTAPSPLRASSAAAQRQGGGGGGGGTLHGILSSVLGGNLASMLGRSTPASAASAASAAAAAPAPAFLGGGWQAAAGSLAAAAAAGGNGGQQQGIVRVLAPNGQPRKVPLSALQQPGACGQRAADFL